MNEEYTVIEQLNDSVVSYMSLYDDKINEIISFQDYCESFLKDMDEYTLRSSYEVFKKELKYMAESVSDSYKLFNKICTFRHFKNDYKFIISSVRKFSDVLLYNTLIEMQNIKGAKMDFDHDIYTILPNSKTDPKFNEEKRELEEYKNDAIYNFNRYCTEEPYQASEKHSKDTSFEQ